MLDFEVSYSTSTVVLYIGILKVWEGPHSFLNTTPKKKKAKRLPKGEQMYAASLISGHATFPVRGTLTIRRKFHKQPVSVPPPSTASLHVVEHSYGKQ